MSHQKYNKHKGSIMALILIISIIVTILGMSMLAVGNQVRIRAVKTNNQTASRIAADAGLTMALETLISQYEDGTLDDNNLPSGTDVAIPNFNGTYTYTITENTGEYTIVCEGNFNGSTKTVQAIVGLEGMTYDFAILTEGQTTLRNSSKVDWYNQGSGGTLKVGTNSTDSSQLWLKNSSEVNGDLYIGPDGIPGVVIKDQGGDYEDSYVQSETVDIPSVNVPDYLSSSSSGGNLNQDDTLTSSDSGKYNKIDLGNSEKLEIDGDVELYITGDITLGNSAEIEILEDSSLTIYVDGDIEGNNSSKFTNQNDDPKLFKLMCTDSCTDVNLKNSGDMYAILYAPKADVSLGNSATYWGAVVANTCDMDNSSTLYYDGSLANYDEPLLTTMKLKSWSE